MQEPPLAAWFRFCASAVILAWSDHNYIASGTGEGLLPNNEFGASLATDPDFQFIMTVGVEDWLSG